MKEHREFIIFMNIFIPISNIQYFVSSSTLFRYYLQTILTKPNRTHFNFVSSFPINLHCVTKQLHHFYFIGNVLIFDFNFVFHFLISFPNNKPIKQIKTRKLQLTHCTNNQNQFARIDSHKSNVVRWILFHLQSSASSSGRISNRMLLNTCVFVCNR